MRDKMKKLYKSRHNKKLAGVCGGIGDYFQIDPTIIRLLVILICFLTAIFPVLIGYIIAALIIPLEPKKRVQKKCKQLYRSRKNRVIAGVLGGFAEFFKVDPILIRIIYIVLMIITGFAPLIITYIVAWVIIPEKPSKNIEIEVVDE